MKIAVTIGDSNGIGFEVFLKALKRINSNKEIEIIFYSNTSIINQWKRFLDIDYHVDNDILKVCQHSIQVVNIDANFEISPGNIDYNSGKLAGDALELAVNDCLSKKVDCLVTLPFSKEAMYLAGWKYPGHTEMLASKTGSKNYMMILFKDSLRCGLATIHIPINEVSKQLTKANLLNSVRILNTSLIQDFGIKHPKIAILGLNPHVGENGAIGSEEIDIIEPAIINAKNLAINLNGPFPADGFFAHKEYLNYDAYLAMYHDQGLIPLKLLAAGGGVNFTAGISFVRTSPDHGTAFSIAGKNIADEQSTLDSINSAIEIFNNRKTFNDIIL